MPDLYKCQFFLPKLGADRFPGDLRQFNIRIQLEADSVLQSPINYRDDLHPRRPFWMIDGPGGDQKTPGNYFAYIEMPEHVYGSISHLNRFLGHAFRTAIHTPTKAYLRLQGLEKFVATNFQPYVAGDVLQEPLNVEEYGRLYLSYPEGPLYTALLQPHETYIRYRSPKSCCPFFPGGRR